MKGALVEFAQAFGALTPNLIVFQFNPETLRHAWTQAQAETSGSNPLAVQGLPGETFSFTLAMDVTDQIIDGNAAAKADAELNGIYARLSALEMLMFPVPPNPAAGASGRGVPASQLPAVLFLWGAGRVVPVRVTSLTITEKLFDEKLNPTHADAVIELRVLTLTELDWVSGPLKELAKAAYRYTQGKREALAIANLNNAAGSFDLPPVPGI
jgi:hypothetical protein